MQKIVSKYAVAAHLALLTVSPLFLFPFCSSSVIGMVILNLTCLAALWVLMEPSRRRHEMLHDARYRLVDDTLKDPLFWVLVLASLLACARWLNGGIAMAYDAENRVWFVREAFASWFPGSMKDCGKMEFAAVPAVCVIVMGVRHALGKSARVSFLFMCSLLGALAAIAAAMAVKCGAVNALSATKIDYIKPSFAGSIFAVLSMCGVVSLSGAANLEWRRLGILFSLGIGATAAGAFFFSPPAALVAQVAAFSIVFIFSLVWTSLNTHGAAIAKVLVFTAIAAVFAVAIVAFLAPDELVAARLDAIQSFDLFPKNFVPRRDMLNSIAQRTWLAHPWLGSGISTFPLDVRFDGTEGLWSIVSSRQTSAIGAWWTILAERGIIGALMLALPLAFLLVYIAMRLGGIISHKSFLPGFALGLIVLALAICESFIDCSFLRPDALMLVAALLAVAASSLAKERKDPVQPGKGD